LPTKKIEVVKQMIKDGIKSNTLILNKIRADMLPQITTMQLNNLKARLKRENIGTSNATLSEIIDWCQERQEIPIDDDQIFCGGIHYEIDDDDEIVSLRVFVTTKRLISCT